jgi:pSer/pThr/pTyr-binding forkhead associated (FHA) protein
MARTLPAAVVQSPGELMAQIEGERAGLPFLVYRDGGDRQRVFTLGEAIRITVGRSSACDVRLDWDSQVSGLHAELERISRHWTVFDDGLSRNGTYVNGERVLGRRRLCDRDAVRFGRTVAIFHEPLAVRTTSTCVDVDVVEPANLSATQRRVLVALCRPFKDASDYVTPATNQ